MKLALIAAAMIAAPALAQEPPTVPFDKATADFRTCLLTQAAEIGKASRDTTPDDITRLLVTSDTRCKAERSATIVAFWKEGKGKFPDAVKFADLYARDQASDIRNAIVEARIGG